MELNAQLTAQVGKHPFLNKKNTLVKMLIFAIYHPKWENEEINSRSYLIHLYNCEEKIIEKKISDLAGCPNLNCATMGAFTIIISPEVWWIWLKERDPTVSGVIVNKSNLRFRRTSVRRHEKHLRWYGKHLRRYGTCLRRCGTCLLLPTMAILGFRFEDRTSLRRRTNFAIARARSQSLDVEIASQVE